MNLDGLKSYVKQRTQFPLYALQDQHRLQEMHDMQVPQLVCPNLQQNFQVQKMGRRARKWPKWSISFNIVLNFSPVAIARPEQKDEGIVVVADELR